MKTWLPTSTAGSLPKPSWLAQPETLWSPWKLSSEELLAGKRDALRLSLDDQLRAGIDIVSDGEQTRQHFVTTFIEHLSGVDFAKREIVKIRNRYEASVPTVVGAVERQKPVFVEDARYLRQLTSQPIKWALPGPMTMIDTLYDNHYKSREKLAIYLENSAVVVAPLIPWSIAGGVPLASAGAPAASLLTAFFLFLLPLWQLVTAGRGRRATV